MEKINVFTQVDQSFVQYWIKHNLSNKDFYCRNCEKLMLDLDQLNGLTLKKYIHVGIEKYGLFSKQKKLIAPNENNRWLVFGRTLSGKTYFRHLCWDCFFDKLFKEDQNIKQKARKGKWYAKIANGARIIPASSTSPSFYFKWLFDITDEELEIEHKKFDTASLDSFIRRFGQVEGPQKFEIYSKRQAYTCSKEYLGMTDEQYKEFNASRASTRENFIKRYGRKIGIKRWNEYCAHESYAGTSLTWFIEKYGKELGTKKYDEICAKKLTYKHCYSKISQELFRSIDAKLGQVANESRWEEKNHELELFCEIETNKKKLVKVDYFLNGKIIEFNGDFWHANPEFYDKNDIIKANRKIAKDIWDWDSKRLNAVKALGYDILIIWESEYKDDKEKTIEKCIKFLTS